MKALKLILFILLGLVLALAIGFGVYSYSATHYWQGPLRRTLRAGFVEKQAAAPDGSVLNYAEGPDNGAPLLLIHGQTGDWTSYTKVLPELSEDWHVFAVDCYGHGKSSHDEAKYYIDENCGDLIWFIDNVIGERTVVSGHSSGALMAASSNEQARRAVSLIEGCELVELKSDHLIHWTHPDTFIDAVNGLREDD